MIIKLTLCLQFFTTLNKNPGQKAGSGLWPVTRPGPKLLTRWPADSWPGDPVPSLLHAQYLRNTGEIRCVEINHCRVIPFHCSIDNRKIHSFALVLLMSTLPCIAHSRSRVSDNWHGCAIYLTTSAWHHLCLTFFKFLLSVWTERSGHYWPHASTGYVNFTFAVFRGNPSPVLPSTNWRNSNWYL